MRFLFPRNPWNFKSTLQNFIAISRYMLWTGREELFLFVYEYSELSFTKLNSHQNDTADLLQKHEVQALTVWDFCRVQPNQKPKTFKQLEGKTFNHGDKAMLFCQTVHKGGAEELLDARREAFVNDNSMHARQSYILSNGVDLLLKSLKAFLKHPLESMISQPAHRLEIIIFDPFAHYLADVIEKLIQTVMKFHPKNRNTFWTRQSQFHRRDQQKVIPPDNEPRPNGWNRQKQNKTKLSTASGICKTKRSCRLAILKICSYPQHLLLERDSKFNIQPKQEHVGSLFSNPSYTSWFPQPKGTNMRSTSDTIQRKL